MRRRATRLAGGVTLVTALAVALSGCVASERDPEGSGEGGGKDTFVFAASADPGSLDPAFASDGESFRVARQIFEGLVGSRARHRRPRPAARRELGHQRGRPGVHLPPQGGRQVPRRHGLQRRGRVLQLRPLGRTGPAWPRPSRLSYYYTARVRRLRARTASTTRARPRTPRPRSSTLKSPLPELVPALSLPSFSMQSPEALEEFDADEVGGARGRPELSEYAKAHPTGTGPYKFDAGTPASASPSRRRRLLGREGQDARSSSSRPSPTRPPAAGAARPVTSTATTWSARPTSSRSRTRASTS